jgi:TolA-binding protein
MVSTAALRHLAAISLTIQCLSVAAAEPVVHFRDAVSARYGREQLRFLDSLIAAKREAPTSPVKSLIESSLWVQSQQDPPPLAATPLALGDVRADDAWLTYAEQLCADERHDLCALALAQIPEQRYGANRSHIDALLVRLAQAGLGPSEARWAGASDTDAGFAMNQVLAQLASGEHAAAKGRRAGDPRTDAVARLRAIAARRDVSPAIRHRALLWTATLLDQTGRRKEALATLEAIDGNTPLQADTALVWLALSADGDPAAAVGVADWLAAQLPASPAAWEARERAVQALGRRGARAQALSVAAGAAADIGAELTRIDQHIEALGRAPTAAYIQTLSLMPEGYRHRVGTLFERKSNLQAAERALNGWMPYVFSYHNRLQDPEKFALEIGKALRDASSQAETPEAARALFSLRLDRMIGTPADPDSADRLFAGLANWGAEADHDADWRPGGKLDEELSRIDRVAERLGELSSGDAARRYREIGVRIRGLVARNQAQVRALRALIDEIDATIRREVIAGLQERRRIVQQWLLRAALTAQQAYLADSGFVGEQPVFDTVAPWAPKADEPLARQLARLRAVRGSRPIADPDLRNLLGPLRSVIDQGEVRELRATALRVRALLVTTLFEAQVLPTPRDAALHYEALLKDYADLVDGADLRYQLARIQDLSGQPEKVRESLNAFVRDYPQDPRIADASFRLAELRFGFGDYEGARVAYEGVLKRGDERYRDQAEYKLAWSLFKQGEHRSALPRFLAVIDRGADPARAGDRLTRERMKDAFRAAALTYSYLDGPADIEKSFARGPKKAYVADLYAGLAQLYLERERINDAARSWEALNRHYPDDSRAPELLAGVVKGAREEGLSKIALDLQEQYVIRYARGGDYWNRADADARAAIDARMQPMLAEMARMYHADAQQQKNAVSRQKAIRYYDQYVVTFPADKDTPGYRFLLAEARYEAGELAAALTDYEAAAYRYGPHAKAAEAGYATLVASQQLVERAKGDEARKRELRALAARSNRFAQGFPQDLRVEAVLAKTGEDLLLLGESAEAAQIGEALIARKPEANIRRRAVLILAHGHFESGGFAQAEQAYAEALTLRPDARQAKELTDRLGLAVYRQAEARRAANNAREAIAGFLRVARAAPGAEAVPNAEIDAAALLLETKRWNEAIDVLERFGKTYPGHKLGADVPTRLAYAYENDGQLLKAADLLETISQSEADDALARQTLWRAAELRDKGGRRDLTLATWERYLKRYPAPLERASEVRQLLADAATKAGDKATRNKWLNEIIATHATQLSQGGAGATVRVAYLAAQAHLVYGDEAGAEFDLLKLKLPLDKSLAAKRKALEQSLKWYDGAGRYGIAEVTTNATYKTAELYARLAKDLMASDRPSGLTALEKEQYDILLEEEAFPFEEKATQIHALNHQRLKDGIYDGWVKRSMGALATLVAARYDRSLPDPPFFAYQPPKPEPVKAAPANGSGTRSKEAPDAAKS